MKNIDLILGHCDSQTTHEIGTYISEILSVSFFAVVTSSGCDNWMSQVSYKKSNWGDKVLIMAVSPYNSTMQINKGPYKNHTGDLCAGDFSVDF